jgi:hypothetical protein
MGKEGNPGLKIFVEFGLLIVLLAAFNLYNYFHGGARLFLVVGTICILGFVGWTLFYLLYVRRSRE